MDPITLVLIALGIAGGFGANVVVTKKEAGLGPGPSRQRIV